MFAIYCWCNKNFNFLFTTIAIVYICYFFTFSISFLNSGKIEQSVFSTCFLYIKKSRTIFDFKMDFLVVRVKIKTYWF